MPSLSAFLWIGFVLWAIGGSILLFGRNLRTIFYGAAAAMAGSILTLAANADFVSDFHGKVIAMILTATFVMEGMYVLFLFKRKKLKKLHPTFYALPFFAFFLIATSREIVSLFVGVEAFIGCLFTLAFYRDRDALDELRWTKESFLSMAGIAYGMALLYVETLSTNLLELRQAFIANHVPLMIIGAGLIGLGIVIKMMSFVSLIRTKKNV